MRLRSLFTVPEGQKVTEKYLHRVLIFSICSIFLCMSCLAGVTWAWFGVTLENTGNVIQIGSPEIDLTVNDGGFASGTTLAVGEHSVYLKHANQPDDLDKKSILYVTFTVSGEEESIVRYVVLNEENQYETGFRIQAEVTCKLSWVVSWFPPDNAEELTEESIVVEAPPEPTTEATEPPTEGTEPPTEGTEPPTEGTEPPTEGTEPPTEGTEPPTEGTEPPTEGTEPPTEATEPPTETTAPPTEATEPPAETTAPSTEAAEPAAEEETSETT